MGTDSLRHGTCHQWVEWEEASVKFAVLKPTNILFLTFASEKANEGGFLKVWTAWVGSEILPIFLFCFIS